MPRAKCGKSTEQTVDFYLTECIWSSPKTEPHLENSRLVVNTTDCVS